MAGPEYGHQTFNANKSMNRSAKLEIDGAEYTFPIVDGTEHEHGIDILLIADKMNCLNSQVMF